MTKTLKKVECEPTCGFSVRCHDEDEIVAITLEHAKKSHGISVTEKDIRGMMKDA